VFGGAAFAVPMSITAEDELGPVQRDARRTGYLNFALMRKGRNVIHECRPDTNTGHLMNAFDEAPLSLDEDVVDRAADGTKIIFTPVVRGRHT